jgi:hypothetical protein
MVTLTPPAMRIKSHWFKSDVPRTPEQHASAMAFITWRVAQQMLKRMRGVNFDIDAGQPYFDFMREVLVFLVAVVDRMAFARLDEDTRRRFTTELVLRVADTLQDNEADLLGGASGGDYRDSFIDLFNELQLHYADFDADPLAPATAGFAPGFAFYRYLGHRLEPTLPPKDRRWVLDQVMATEAPQAVDVVADSMRNVFDPAPPAQRRTRVHGD